MNPALFSSGIESMGLPAGRESRLKGEQGIFFSCRQKDKGMRVERFREMMR
jgi:hypothetical protein